MSGKDTAVRMAWVTHHRFGFLESPLAFMHHDSTGLCLWGSDFGTPGVGSPLSDGCSGTNKKRVRRCCLEEWVGGPKKRPLSPGGEGGGGQ